MKKRILALLALCSAFFVATSGINTTNNSSNNTNSSIKITAEEIGDIKGSKTVEGVGTVSFTSAKESSIPIAKNPEYDSTNKCIVYYALNGAGCSMTITSSFKFKKVIFETVKGDDLHDNSFVASKGKIEINKVENIITWTSNEDVTNVKFQNTATNDFTRITSFTVGVDATPTVSLTNASDSIGGYYKDGDTKKQFVSFGATITALPEKDLSLVTEYGINVYSDSDCSKLVTTKSATIGSGGHTIDELKGQGGRFYTILSGEDGIVDKKPYYAKAYVKESSGAGVESSTAMNATADTGGTEYIL